MPDTTYPMHVGIVVTSAAQLSAVYALLGGTALATITSGDVKITPTPAVSAAQTGSAPIEPTTEASTAAADAGELDSAGWPWSPELHASTKGTTKEGLWRMKVGVSRPDPKPGYPKDGATPNGATGTSNSTTAGAATGTATGAAASSTVDDDDEFAAFAKANGSAPAASARVWSDADLGALCSQAAQKLGDPAPIREVIGKFMPEGAVAHSRNVPAEKRGEFAAAIEKAADFKFAG